MTNELPTPEQVERIQSAEELRVKLAITNLVIKKARQDGDARWKNVLPLQRLINERLVAAERRERAQRGEPEPKTQTVVLNTANLRSRAVSTRK